MGWGRQQGIRAICGFSREVVIIDTDVVFGDRPRLAPWARHASAFTRAFEDLPTLSPPPPSSQLTPASTTTVTLNTHRQPQRRPTA